MSISSTTDMHITVQRGKDDGNAILGQLLLDGVFECYDLEPSATAEYPCIQAGTYAVKLLFSNRFQRLTPHILGVPGRTAIEIHPGNKPKDTEGCTLVGETEDHDWVGSSQVAFQALMAKLAQDKDNLTITFQNF